jgi:hypothetical protein
LVYGEITISLITIFIAEIAAVRPSSKCEGNTGDVVGVTTGGPDGDFFTYGDNEVIVVCP